MAATKRSETNCCGLSLSDSNAELSQLSRIHSGQRKHISQDPSVSRKKQSAVAAMRMMRSLLLTLFIGSSTATFDPHCPNIKREGPCKLLVPEDVFGINWGQLWPDWTICYAKSNVVPNTQVFVQSDLANWLTIRAADPGPAVRGTNLFHATVAEGIVVTFSLEKGVDVKDDVYNFVSIRSSNPDTGTIRNVSTSKST